VDQAELVKRMASATGLVFPSIWLEGLALVCLEALSAGLPVLAFDDVPAGRTVEDLGIGVTGPRADVDQLLRRAAATFPALRTHCRDVYEREFTATAWVRRAEDTYADARRSASG
jgi:glycosyltransferase involved in cell wall biosynthesis